MAILHEPAGPGAMVVVVGPSGAGKDSLIAFVRDRLGGDGRFHFVRRVVTRPADAGGEDHAFVPPERFEEMARAGAFALDWRAHGLAYGIPAEVDAVVAAGGVAVANLSRRAVAAARARYRRVVVVEVTAPLPVLAERLAGRGRESAESVAQRLARSVDAPLEGAVQLDNSGPLEIAGARFVALLAETAAGVEPR